MGFAIRKGENSMNNCLHVFVCDPTIVLRKPISGQDFYLQRIIKVMKAKGYNVVVVSPKEMKALVNVVASFNNVLFHLHYANLHTVMLAKTLFDRATNLLYVYQLDDPTWTRLEKLKSTMFLRITSALNLVQGYITPSYVLAKELRYIVNPKKTWVLEPYYPCRTKNSLQDIINKKIHDLESKRLNLLIIGRINRYRIDLDLIFKVLKQLINNDFRVTLRIVSMKEFGLSTQYMSLHKDGLKLEIIGRRLTEEEKAEIFRDSHMLFFVVRGYVAMHPPLSVIESVCYATIPLVSPVVSEFRHLEDIVVENFTPSTIVEKIMRITASFETISSKLYHVFERFYSKNYLLNQLLNIVNGVLS
jgi:hypothetical protein